MASGAQLSTSLTGSGVPVYIETPLTNQSGGTVTIGAPDTRQDDNTLTTNAGTLQVVNGGHLTLSSSSTLTNTGTLGAVSYTHLDVYKRQAMDRIAAIVEVSDMAVLPFRFVF